MRTQIFSYRTLGLVSACVCLLLTFQGCGAGGADARLRVLSFNVDNINGVFLNERLIFTFSAPVDPESVNISTLQIRYDASQIDVDGDCFPDDPQNTNAIPEGEFLVEGNRIIFQPRIPTSPLNNDVGLFPTHDIASAPDPINCNRNTELVITYNVMIPGFSAEYPKTIVSLRDKKPVTQTYHSVFSTIRDETFPPLIDLASFIDLGPGAPVYEGLVTPTEGSTDVPLDASVEIQFSEALLPSSLNSESMFLQAIGPSSGRQEMIPASMFIDQISGRVLLFPLMNLPADTEVTVMFTRDIVDFGGNQLEIPPGFEFPTFHTVSAPVSGPFLFREDFVDQDFRNADETSALWDHASEPGFLAAGRGGGTAFLGALSLDPEFVETFEFDTGTYDPNNPYPSFDYSSVYIGERAFVKVVGENPLIFKSTTDIVVVGSIDASGEDAGTVSSGAVAGTPGGAAVGGGGAGGDGGSVDGEDGGDGLSARVVGTDNDRYPGGGGGSTSVTCAENDETGGGGGGEFAGSAIDGEDDGGGTGGSKGQTYGSEDLNPFEGKLLGGSGGGGAGTTCFNDVIYPGSGGGAGGGAVWLHAAGSVRVEDGNIDANGGDGGDNQYSSSTRGGAGGGGGSGGGILFQGINMVMNTIGSDISASRGIGGACSEGGNPDGEGGSGGKGRIRIEGDSRDLQTISINPSPSQADYSVDGQTSVGTSEWIDTGALFSDFTFAGKADNDDSAGATIQYLFQGAPPDPDNPDQPDLDKARPGVGEFTSNIDDIDDTRFIRIKVIFTYAFPHDGILPKTDYLELSYTYRGGTAKN